MRVRAWLVLLLTVLPLPVVARSLDTFARCLSDRGAVFYGAVWCGHCRAQQRMFGTAFRHVSYRECSDSGSAADRKACRDAGVKSFPTWTFENRGRTTGRLSLEQLASRTGCTLSNESGGDATEGARSRGGVTDLSGRGVRVIEVP